ncbi:short-chain dehydrogenase [Lentinus brumalis]|uniref:Short-chain dehydrogenase n=1 Tax=Lentinus brumalis TaxID=2498619 RepID=A0A371DSQ8_9APHY|nr:short-chain dehydrogenase [Polyporus brumalis]
MATKPTVFLTGASRGLGLAIAKILLEDFNANLATYSRTTTPELQSLADAHTDSFLVLRGDVTNAAGVQTAIARTVEKFGSLDSVILNAGVLEPFGKVDSDVTIEQWKELFDINFFSLVIAIRAALPHLRKSAFGGRVVFMSSGAAVGHIPAWAPYNASKAAMNSLCGTLAAEEPQVTFVAIEPGVVETDMQTAIRSKAGGHMPPEAHKYFLDSYEQGQLAKPEDPGYVTAALAIKAPKSLSGKFVSYDDDNCKEFRLRK